MSAPARRPARSGVRSGRPGTRRPSAARPSQQRQTNAFLDSSGRVYRNRPQAAGVISQGETMRTLITALAFFTVSAFAQTPGTLPDLTCTELATSLRTVAAQDLRLRDFPNLARYREANRSVKDVTVVFMGDSITDNW